MVREEVERRYGSDKFSPIDGATFSGTNILGYSSDTNGDDESVGEEEWATD